MPHPTSGALAPGVHAFDSDGVTQRYHVYGSGPVCLAHPGGPGIHWEYLRMPALEQHLTMVYVAAYHAIHRPAGLAGVILYEGAPVTGPEHGAEAARRLQEFAAAHTDRPELNDVLAAFGAMHDISSDEQTLAVARGVLPSYIADYWGDEPRWAPVRDALRADYISGLDAVGRRDLVDDRADLPKVTVPALIVVGLFDVICGPRWARELCDLIPDSRLVILEHSGHLGHLEEPGRFADAVRNFTLPPQSMPSPSDGDSGRSMP
ncbi:alpha/beta fold hydrolase [Nocardia amamiensis]|uniref:alpha/beta fold hydrolase n=1 Tax=Nocardia TaxID=1817 RepID=UPI0033EA1155